MKISVRIGLTILATSLFGLFGGCASQSATAMRRAPANDFEIVETSSKRRLTAAEMAHLRAKVADYLAQQGESATGDYYVKIYLGEEPGIARGEWVVVRFTRYPSALVGQLASADFTGYPGYPPYQYDLLPFGWLGFSAFSFRYYDDPAYFGYPGYFPHWYRPRHAGRGRDHDRKRDEDGDRPRRWNHGHPHEDGRRHPVAGTGYRPPGVLNPSFVPSQPNRPHWDRPREDADPEPRHPRRDFQRRDGRDGRRERFMAGPPQVAPGTESQPAQPSPRVHGPRGRDPGEPLSPRPRHEPASGGRQRDFAPPGREEPRREPRSHDTVRPERVDRDGGNDSGRESEAVQRPVLQDGGRRARER